MTDEEKPAPEKGKLKDLDAAGEVRGGDSVDRKGIKNRAYSDTDVWPVDGQ